MPAVATEQAYSRAEVRRLLGVSEQQLRSWQKQNFIPAAASSFSFSDLLAMRTLAALRKNRIPAAQIRRAVNAVRSQMKEIENPLTELRVYSQGKRVRVQFGKQTMEVSGQLILDFNEEELNKLVSFPERRPETEKPGERNKKRVEAEHWFEQGLLLEQQGAQVEEIIYAYQKAAELDPSSAGALVNLGTVYFNVRAYREAEKQYRKALEVDANYALAHFNLGNLFDERNDRAKALFHYQAALRIHPNYADAHYNIALLYQSTNQPMKAVRHWKHYLKLDPNSNWAAIARRELERLRDLTIVRNNRPD
ncbi:MAG TPA: tetratricopeptide repeat protein [Bryobacteraceae bacterium]|nr:tetratricopeptide repeat protein [Bryobacteraceae bacterium]